MIGFFLKIIFFGLIYQNVISCFVVLRLGWGAIETKRKIEQRSLMKFCSTKNLTSANVTSSVITHSFIIYYSFKMKECVPGVRIDICYDVIGIGFLFVKLF